MEMFTSTWWAALSTIIVANILLSGDNAVVIAMAARALPVKQQKQAIFIGSAAAIVMRIVLTLVAAKLLSIPWLKTIGALLLLYIGISLLAESEDEGEGDGKSHGSMAAAIRTILIADLVMSLDNVIAVAAAAHGDIPLLVIGLATSIPLVIFGSTILLKVIDKFPVIVWAGAALLGFIAGEILEEDPALHGFMENLSQSMDLSHAALARIFGVVGALIVLAVGFYLKNKHEKTAVA